MKITTLLQTSSEAREETPRPSPSTKFPEPALLQLSMLLEDIARVDRLATELSKRLPSTIVFTFHNVVAGRFREEQEADAEDQCPSKLQTDGDAVGAGVGVVFCSEIDAGREEDADCDGELFESQYNWNETLKMANTDLITANYPPSNAFRRDLTDVHNHTSRHEPNTQPSNSSSSSEQSHLPISNNLEHNTNNVDPTSQYIRFLATPAISCPASEDSTEESTKREDGCNERFLPGREEITTKGVGVRGWDTEIVVEFVHRQDSVDVAGVVAEEDAAKSSETAYHDTFESDGGLCPSRDYGSDD